MKTLKIYGLIASVLLSILLIDGYLINKVVAYSRLTTSNYYTQDAINTAIIYTIVQMVLLSLGSYFIILVLLGVIKAEQGKTKTINKIEELLERIIANRNKTEKRTTATPIKHEDIFVHKPDDKIRDINSNMFELKTNKPLIYTRSSIKPNAKVGFLSDEAVDKLISYMDSIPETRICTYIEKANSIATWYYNLPANLRLTNEVLKVLCRIRPNREDYSLAEEGADQYDVDYQVYTDYAKGELLDTIEWFRDRGYTVK